MKPNRDNTSLVKYSPLSMDGNMPWNRYKDESSVAYNAFTIFMYLDPAVRSLKQVIIILNQKRNSIDNLVCNTVHNYLSMCQLAKKYNWKERVRAYDDFCVQVQIRSRMQSIIRMNESHCELAQEYINALSIYYLAIKRKMETTPACLDELSEMPLFVLIDKLREGVKDLDMLMQMERRAHGLSDKNIAIHEQVDVQHKGEVEVSYRKRLESITEDVSKDKYK